MAVRAKTLSSSIWRQPARALQPATEDDEKLGPEGLRYGLSHTQEGRKKRMLAAVAPLVNSAKVTRATGQGP